MVQKHKEQVVNKQNDYRARLGLEQNSTIPDSGLDLSGVGYSMGSTVSTGLGRDAMPGGEKTLSVVVGGAKAPGVLLVPGVFVCLGVGESVHGDDCFGCVAVDLDG